MLAARLPARARWRLGDSPLDWDFSRAAHPLEALPEDHAQTLAAILPNDWRELLIFGEDDYAEGGGAQSFLTVHTRTGEVFGVDGERDAPVYFLSSSVTAFVETFLPVRPGPEGRGRDGIGAGRSSTGGRSARLRSKRVARSRAVHGRAFRRRSVIRAS